MSEAGSYSVAIDTYLEYVVGSVKGMNVPGKPGVQTKINHSSSPPEIFEVKEKNPSRKTLGQKARSLEESKKFSLKSFPVEDRNPIEMGKEFQICQDPDFQGGSQAQKEEAIERSPSG